MKRLIILVVLMWLSWTAVAQNSEFTIHDNGLIYGVNTMDKLGQIVDSLNLKFKACDPKIFRSLAQGYGTYFEVRSSKQARDMIRRNASPDDFAAAFPEAKKRKEWVVRHEYTYGGHRRVEYASLPLRKQTQIEITVSGSSAHDKPSGWVFSDEDGRLKALFLHNVCETTIPNTYARLIQYVDCMIDTTAQIYQQDEATFEKPPATGSKADQFLKWANRYEPAPEMPDIDWDSRFAETQYHTYIRELEQWNNKRLSDLDVRIGKGHFYKSLLMDAAEEAIAEKTSNAELEFYVERYLSAGKALEMKRSRKPMGFCSMDTRPREHAASICRLAAETAQWDIFLRAHLDIMNDRFDRRSDGSYAWASRGTYLKELEMLEINAPDLLIGTCLRSSNVSDNHYYGNIPRIGRALSETSDPDSVVAIFETMIADEKLDLFNRLMISYLFDNFVYHFADEDIKIEYGQRLLNVTRALPENIGRTFERK